MRELCEGEIMDEINFRWKSPDDISNTLPELIWRGDSVHGTASVSIPTQRKVNKELDIFCSLYKQLIDERSPISIFSILTIERDMNKWPENVQPLLVDILSDNGFLFDEACPDPDGVYSIRAYAAIKRSGTWKTLDYHYIAKSDTLTRSEWDKDSMISEAKKRLYYFFSKPNGLNLPDGINIRPDILPQYHNEILSESPKWLNRYLQIKFLASKDEDLLLEDFTRSMELPLYELKQRERDSVEDSYMSTEEVFHEIQHIKVRDVVSELNKNM